MFPAVTVLTPTYGRTRTLVECLYSFAVQDYPGHAEMVILNDHPEQTLLLEPVLPRPVTIINAKARYATLGDKRNALVAYASTPLVAFWDDDDVYLPTALSRTVERYRARLQQKRRAGRESHCWQVQQSGGGPEGVGRKTLLSNNLELIIRDSGTLWSQVTERLAILDVGGFPAWERMQDVGLLRRLITAKLVGAESNTPGIPSCIHRIAGTPYAHAVDFTAWKGPQDNLAAQAFHDAATAQLIDSGMEPRGLVSLTPRWSLDWEALTKAAWESVPDRGNVPHFGAPPDPLL